MILHKISVIIPVYNEELFLEKVLTELQQTRLPDALQIEIIVIDDGSTDQTRTILHRLEQTMPLKICRLENNRGKGAALREGLKQATGEVVVIQDADLEYSIEDYPRLLEPFLRGDAQVVYGSRFLGTIQGMKLPNRIFNLLIRGLVNVFFDAHITDEATAYKLLRTDLLRSLNLTAERFEVCPEITAKVLRRKIPIHEVPIRYRGRTQSEGKKVGWRDAVTAVATLLKYRWKD